MQIRKKQPTNSTHGFTLLELLIVIAIISILASISMVNLSIAKGRARDALRINDLGQIRRAVEYYFQEFGGYPCGDNNELVGRPGTVDSNGSGGWCEWNGSGSPPPNDEQGFMNGCGGGDCTQCDTSIAPSEGLYYFEVLNTGCPRDPIHDTIDGVSYRYWYHASADRQLYMLTTHLESGRNAMANDGGRCNDVLEIGNGVGTLYPSNLLGLPSCNPY